ncbi:MAG: hypothetical protein M0Z96_05735 [Actinomycetota bacterium]|nr:hypothetical protein [Actinomycetota bacterium]
MANLLYLGIPVAILVMVGLVISLRERRPRPIATDVDEFARSMKALSSTRNTRPASNSRGTDAG